MITVRHADEGGVSVRVLSSSQEAVGALAFTGEIHRDSSMLRVSDVVGTHAVTIPMAEGTHPVDVYVDSAVEATRVDVVNN